MPTTMQCERSAEAGVFDFSHINETSILSTSVFWPPLFPATLSRVRRASFLLNELREEQRNGKRCEMPDLKIGDAVEVTVSVVLLCAGFIVNAAARNQRVTRNNLVDQAQSRTTY